MIKTAENRYTARPDIAHTSAIYVDLNGQSVFYPEDARFWLDRFYRHLENIRNRARFANDGQRREALDHVQEGIHVLEEKLRNVAKK